MHTIYGFGTKVSLPYEQVVSRVKELLQAEGFGVLSEIDVRQTLKQKLNAEFRKYVILGACNPTLAQHALGVELEIGLLLPCNVIIYEDDGGAVVSIMDPSRLWESWGRAAAANRGRGPRAARASDPEAEPALGRPESHHGFR
jgi:uncharacterized protein (DUF302 family)